jgi:hypothetical protein
VATTASGTSTAPGPSTSGSTSTPGAASYSAAVPSGIHAERVTAPPTPSAVPIAAATVGAAAPVIAAVVGVIPSARSTRRSAAVAAPYRVTACPTSTTDANSAISPRVSRLALSNRATSRWWSTNPDRLSTSTSGRPETRARSARNAGRSASPPRSRTRALTGAPSALPSRFAG